MVEQQANNADAHKDSCSYGIALSKQFITLSVAGIAFVGGLAITQSASLPNDKVIIIFISLGLSIGAGLLFIMNVIGHININNNYDVYTTGPRIMAFFQLLFFVIGVAYLAYMSMASISMMKIHKSENVQPVLNIYSDNNKINYPLTRGNDINLKIFGTCELEIN